MIGEFGNERFMRFREQSIYDRPDKHVKRTDKRNINQQSRSKWLRRQTHFFQQPSAEILQREDMTAPAADISPEDQGRQDRQGEKDESRVNEPLLQSVHG